MQTNPAVEQNKNIKSPESPWNQSGIQSQKNSYQTRIISVVFWTQSMKLLK